MFQLQIYGFQFYFIAPFLLMAIYLKVQFSTKICPFLAIICGLCVIDLLFLTKHGHPIMHETRNNIQCMGILANISESKMGRALVKDCLFYGF